MDEELEKAHKHASNHRWEILNSKQCGCFHCLSIFPASQILGWIDEDNQAVGQTALCPSCDVDAVLGDKSSLRIDKEFLVAMKKYWFES